MHPAWWAALASACLALGCRSDVDVGTWSCPWPPRIPDGGSPDTLTAVKEPVRVPWTTGFERGTCDYDRVLGYCYAHDDSTFEVVDSPVHSGEHAMKFSGTGSSLDVRCVREGELPSDAKYGAWFYLTSAPAKVSNWNLMHFHGGPNLSFQWDVSLEVGNDGKLYPYLRDYNLTPVPSMPMAMPSMQLRGAQVAVPIQTWFHLEFRWQRAAEATGTVGLYLDGQPLLERTGVVTDRDLPSWGQWYVGNNANGLNPPDSTLYVDDVTIRSAQ